MTFEEAKHHHFREVICLHCKAPIPVPAIVGHTGTAPHEGVDLSQGNSQVFNVRCPVCHKEKPYWTQEIVTFEGTPGQGVRSAESASARATPQAEIGKAAKA